MSDPLTIRTIRIRRDTASNWNQKNPILKLGEPGLETDTRKLKFGDGVSTWNNLLYTGSDTDSTILLENIDDRVASLLKAGSNIVISYDDNSDSLVIDAINIPQSKNDLGLGNVDNTSDIDKPVSVSQANADIAIQQLAASDASVKMESAKEYSTQRSNHVGTQSIDTIDNLNSTIQDINLQLESLLVAEDNIISVNGQIGEVVLTKDDIGLNNVDNTSDASKPVSSATQAALNLKSNIGHDHTISNISGLQSALDGKQASGDYATLVDGAVPANQLPSYVDDIIEATNLASLPVNGESSKIYVTLDNNKTYRWSGSSYVEIIASPGNTDAVPEGSVNKYYTDARASAAANDATTKAEIAKTYAVQRSNHTGTQPASTISDFADAVSNQLSTDLIAGNGISLTYNNIDDNLVISTTESTTVLDLGSWSGTTTRAINFGADRLIQTVSLNGGSSTLTKGVGWPSSDNLSADVILRMTVNSPTTLIWNIITDWFTQPSGGALVTGTHLFLIRAIGSNIVEGHYLGNKTN